MPVERGLTTPELARRWRVSEDKIRGLIRAGKLAAINTNLTDCGKPRYVVVPEAIEAFERGRAVGPTPKVKRMKRRAVHDHYPDGGAD